MKFNSWYYSIYLKRYKFRDTLTFVWPISQIGKTNAPQF